MKRRHGVLALPLVGALAWTGCDEDRTRDLDRPKDRDASVAPFDMGIDAGAAPDASMGAPDGGMMRPDGGTMRPDGGMTRPDGGMTRPDGGMTRPDGGMTGPDGGMMRPDGGMTGPDGGTRPDGGGVVSGGEEGGRCQPGATPCQQGLQCVSLSPMSTPPASQLLVCLNTCMTNADCAGSALSPPAQFCSSGICVQELEPEGGIADFFRDTNTQTLKGCQSGLERYVGAQFGLETDQEFACVRTCMTSADCTTQGINFCNRNDGLLTNMGQSVNFGMCTRGPGLAGDPCSDRDATRACTLDFNDQGLVFCVDNFSQVFNKGSGEGICTQLCGDTDGNPTTPPLACQAQYPNQTAPRCQTGSFQNPNIGVCSDDCSPFPNSCTNPSSSGCFPFPQTNLGMLDNQVNRRCLQTPASGAALPAYDLNGVLRRPNRLPTPAENCAGRENDCPDGSFCLALQNNAQGRPAVAACVHGCDPARSPAQNGCGNVTIGGSATTCQTLRPGDSFGFCVP